MVLKVAGSIPDWASRSVQCVPAGPAVARFTLLMLLFLQDVY